LKKRAQPSPSDVLDQAQRALAHAAHVYHSASAERKVEALQQLYKAARDYGAALLLEGNR
jgi:hypothetical protein